MWWKQWTMPGPWLAPKQWWNQSWQDDFLLHLHPSWLRKSKWKLTAWKEEEEDDESYLSWPPCPRSCSRKRLASTWAASWEWWSELATNSAASHFHRGRVSCWGLIQTDNSCGCFSHGWLALNKRGERMEGAEGGARFLNSPPPGEDDKKKVCERRTFLSHFSRLACWGWFVGKEAENDGNF